MAIEAPTIGFSGFSREADLFSMQESIGVATGEIPSDLDMDTRLADLRKQVDEIFTPEVMKEMPSIPGKNLSNGDCQDSDSHE